MIMDMEKKGKEKWERMDKILNKVSIRKELNRGKKIFKDVKSIVIKKEN